MQRIILHIGDKKTGSTAIQQALASNAWKCEAVSLDYVVPPNAPYHHALAHAIATNGSKAVSLHMSDLAKRVAASRADVVVISSELFRDADPEVVRKLFETHLRHHMGQLEVLGYMRPHIARFVSNYAQIVKLGVFDGMPEWHFRNTKDHPAYCHADLFLRWREVFGDRLMVRPMVRAALQDGDVVRDFFHIVLGGADFTLTPLPAINAAPSLQELALLRRFHMDFRAVHEGRDSRALKTARMRVGERLGELIGSFTVAHPPIRMQIDRALTRQIADTYGEDAARADEAFFDGPLMQDALAAAVESAPEVVPSYLAKDHFSRETLQSVSLLARLIGEMLLHDPEGWDDHFMSILNRMLRGAEDPLDGV